ncbi:MAG TPA: DNA repair protein RecN [Acidimicrobiales bacterium]|nr:DNA repair protein RecN [Acidimicrobiales bacterium]
MLVELRVKDLGVIDEVTLDLTSGMTALTGETGAGKTLIVEALELLVGGRADPVLVRPGADQALVEGRFVVDDEEIILARAVATKGRSRAWIDGRMAPVSALAEVGARLVDLHGQHAHQSLLDPAMQRRSLDAFCAIDLTPLTDARVALRGLVADLDALGGDERARAREIDLLRHQLSEIDAAGLSDPDEDSTLAAEEERLAEADAHRDAAAAALAALDTDGDGPATSSGRGGGGALDLIGAAHGALAGRAPLLDLAGRLAALQAETADVATELRQVVDTWEADPERLAEIRTRRNLLHELSRKYGEGTAGVRAYGEEIRARVTDLESVEERAAALQARITAAESHLAAVEAEVGRARRRGAPDLARAVEKRLQTLAMARARLEVTVGESDPGDDVSFLLGANPGEAVLPLAKVASGGELARAMLALRLVLTDAPPTIVFDEVDAGIGGEAALAVGRALAEVGHRHQVLVVTHLAQVAAYAGHQFGVRKEVEGKRTLAVAHACEADDRVVELARMLSGQPDSATARRHARELLAQAVLHPPVNSRRLT